MQSQELQVGTYAQINICMYIYAHSATHAAYIARYTAGAYRYEQTITFKMRAMKSVATTNKGDCSTLQESNNSAQLLHSLSIHALPYFHN